VSDDKPLIGEMLPQGQAEARAESWQAAGRKVRVVDGRQMLLMIVVNKNEQGGTEMRAEAPGCSRRNAAAILRYVADSFDADADRDGDGPATFDPAIAAAAEKAAAEESGEPQ
jgi:hypothetical protein